MRTIVEKLIIAQNAQTWLAARNLVPLDWDELPFFPDPLIPIWAVTDKPPFDQLPFDAEVRSRIYRSKYDPDETTNWAFVPGPENRVWMVSVKRRPSGLN